MKTKLRADKAIKNSFLIVKASALLRDTRGNFATILALASVPLLIGVGVAVDYGNVVRVKSNMQDAMDHAVLAGKQSRLKPAEQLAVAEKAFQTNYRGDVENSAPLFFHEGDVLHGDVEVAVDTMFGKVLGKKTMPAKVQSAASSSLSRGPLCFMAMHPTRAHTLELVDTVSVMAPDCNIYGNSSHHDDVVDPHNEENFLTAKSVQAIGYGHHYIENVTPPLEYAPELIPDPLKSMVIPSAGTCMTMPVLSMTGMNKLSPGTYCGGIEIDGAYKVMFQKGTYIITGGDFEVSGARIEAKDVTFVLKDGAEIAWEETDMEIRAPKNGPFAGMAIIGDRVGSKHEMADSNIDIHGVVYLPQGVFEWYNLGEQTPKAKWTAWIIDGVTWGGEGTINIPFKINEGPVPYPGALRNVIPRDESIRLVY